MIEENFGYVLKHIFPSVTVFEKWYSPELAHPLALHFFHPVSSDKSIHSANHLSSLLDPSVLPAPRVSRHSPHTSSALPRIQQAAAAAVMSLHSNFSPGALGRLPSYTVFVTTWLGARRAHKAGVTFLKAFIPTAVAYGTGC